MDVVSTHKNASSSSWTYHYFIYDRKTSLNYPHLPPDLTQWLNLSDSNYSCLEQIFMVQKMFAPLKFDFNHKY